MLATTLVVLVLSGCGTIGGGGDGGGGGGGGGEAEGGLPAGIGLGDATRYVALGDSFSAGDGLAPYVDAACDRSPRAYPNLLRFDGEVNRISAACSAAYVRDVAGQAAAAQLGDDVGLVTLTIGGNDAGFIDFFGACALRTSCFDQPYEGYASLGEWSKAQIDALGPALTAAIDGVQQAAPNTRVVVAGYPQLLPTTFSTGAGCELLSAGFDASELAALRTSTLAVNGALAQATEAAGATFVDVVERFAGHEACGGPEPWLMFGTLEQLLTSPEGVLHPNDAGQRAYADAITAALG